MKDRLRELKEIVDTLDLFAESRQTGGIKSIRLPDLLSKMKHKVE
jgi:hypothetical protein